MKNNFKIKSFNEKSFIKPDFAKKVSVGLVYPNEYALGMDNLGFQTIYRLINQRPDTYCERIFLEKGTQCIQSLESNKPLNSFDLIAVSISYELDIINFLKVLNLAKIPLYSKQRNSHWPLILAGGIAVFPNPEPLADFIDAAIIGEGEKVINEFLDVYIASYLSTKNENKKLKTLSELNKIEGLYIPNFFTPIYNEDNSIKEIFSLTFREKIKKRYCPALNFNTNSCFLTSASQFSDTFLIEIGRGCGQGCRFCMVGFVYRCPRLRDSDQILKLIKSALALTNKIGLLGASLSFYKDLNKLCAEILDKKGVFSLSSLRPDMLTEELLKCLVRSGQDSITIAPETGSPRLKKVINKNISNGLICEQIEKSVKAGLKNIKLYFLIGLPTETDADINLTIELIKNIRTRTPHKVKLIINISPFIPKPWTPFQWAKMEEKNILKKRLDKIKKEVMKLKNVTVRALSINESIWQALISKGDRRISAILKDLAQSSSYNIALHKYKDIINSIIYLEKTENETFPWDILDMGVSKKYLWSEYQKAMRGETTLACEGEKDCKACKN